MDDRYQLTPPRKRLGARLRRAPVRRPLGRVVPAEPSEMVQPAESVQIRTYDDEHSELGEWIQAQRRRFAHWWSTRTEEQRTTLREAAGIFARILSFALIAGIAAAAVFGYLVPKLSAQTQALQAQATQTSASSAHLASAPTVDGHLATVVPQPTVTTLAPTATPTPRPTLGPISVGVPPRFVSGTVQIHGRLDYNGPVHLSGIEGDHQATLTCDVTVTLHAGKDTNIECRVLMPAIANFTSVRQYGWLGYSQTDPWSFFWNITALT